VENFVNSKISNVIKRDPSLAKTTSMIPKLPLTACLESSRKEDGIYGHYRRLLNSGQRITGKILQMFQQTHKPAKVKGPPMFRPAEEPSEEQSLTAATILQAAWNEFDTQPHNKGSVEVVLEPGYKARVVTKSPAHLIILGTPINDRLMSILDRLAPSRPALQPNSKEHVRRRLDKAAARSGPDFLCYSADLLKATDQIPLDVAHAAWKGIVSALGLSSREEHLGYEILSPKELTYPDGSTTSTKGGILMGLPLVWPILSLLNMWAAEAGAHEGSKKSYVVCGDDLAALWNKEQIQRYEKNLHSIHLSRNKYKELLNSEGFVFCEEYFRVNKQTRTLPGRRLILQKEETVILPTSVSSITRVRLASLLQPTTMSGPAKVLTEIEQLRGATTQMWPALKRWQKPRIIELSWQLHHKTLTKLRRLGFSLGSPQILGGVGLPFGKISARQKQLFQHTFIEKKITPSTRIIMMWATCSNATHIARAGAEAIKIAEQLGNTRRRTVQGVPLRIATQKLLAASMSTAAMNIRESKRPTPLFTVLRQIRAAASAMEKRLPPLTAGVLAHLPRASTVLRLCLPQAETQTVNREEFDRELKALQLPLLSLFSGRKLNRDPPRATNASRQDQAQLLEWRPSIVTGNAIVVG